MIAESLAHLSEKSMICVALMVYVIGVGALVRIPELESKPTEHLGGARVWTKM